ncbi:MAG: YihA family ribosome biogenesis GTP-binding protein [Alphaproteobacteria bacterium]|nr:YihA family ribosome biogenesis GTP-binding protein [Alphaproteobacteria bacterium]
MGDHAPRRRGVSTATSPAEDAPDESEIEAGRLLFARECTFLAGAASLDALPPDALPEIAFAGRSNVGKSSLLNALAGRTALARTSHTPGRTRQLNFFDLGNRLTLVDMPGYGYAAAPKHEIARWTELIRVYLGGRASLRRVCLLIDARHGLKPVDRPLMDMLDAAAVSFQIVLTKADKVKPEALEAGLAAVAAELGKHVAAHPIIHVTSARGGTGIAALRAALAALAAPAPAR